jgi:anaphase-promoting complex subunit 2
MDEDLLSAALQFWVNKLVLRKLPNLRYVVIERLQDAEQQLALSNAKTLASSQATLVDNTAAVTTPRKTKSGISEKDKEKRQVYWSFIVGMLTNSRSTMLLGQISMMMKTMMAGGFPWSNEELQEFLGDKVSEGELELAGGKYKLVKK